MGSSRAVHAWLMLLPALVLLATFTHYPAIATLIDSFFSTPRGSRPSVWVGLENYQVMLEDPIFWQALRNNLWFALGTILAWRAPFWICRPGPKSTLQIYPRATI